jgi:DNA-binding NarL/FixJ family response regulator
VKRRVVLVDDHELFRAGVRGELAASVDIVGEAGTVADAVPLIRELDPDVVLLDVHLPDIDGFDVAEALTRQDEPPVVVLTSSRHRSDLPPLARTCHAHGFIDKEELTAEALAELVRARL